MKKPHRASLPSQKKQSLLNILGKKRWLATPCNPPLQQGRGLHKSSLYNQKTIKDEAPKNKVIKQKTMILILLFCFIFKELFSKTLFTFKTPVNVSIIPANPTIFNIKKSSL
jgi:hypothetical protein